MARRRFASLVLVVLCVMPGREAPVAREAATSDVRDIRDIKDIRNIRGPLPFSGFPPFVLTAGVVTAAAATAGYLSFRRRNRRAPAVPISPRGSEAPVDTLNRFAASYRRGELPADSLCLHLAPLLRSTLSGRTGLAGSCLTTPELLQRIEGEALLPPQELRLAAELLDLCDRVKFAAYRPEHPEAEAFLAAAARLVEGSREEPHEVS